MEDVQVLTSADLVVMSTVTDEMALICGLCGADLLRAGVDAMEAQAEALTLATLLQQGSAHGLEHQGGWFPGWTQAVEPPQARLPGAD